MTSTIMRYTVEPSCTSSETSESAAAVAAVCAQSALIVLDHVIVIDEQIIIIMNRAWLVKGRCQLSIDCLRPYRNISMGSWFVHTVDAASATDSDAIVAIIAIMLKATEDVH